MGDLGLGEMRAVSRIKLYPDVAIHLKKSLETWVRLIRLTEKCIAQFVLRCGDSLLVYQDVSVPIQRRLNFNTAAV
jgi:hypothetical protein